MVGYRCSLAGGGNYSYTAVSINAQTGVKTTYKPSCANMFADNTLLNSPVTIGENINNCEYMFSNCQQFNQNVVIPNIPNLSIDYMFNGCTRLNQNIQIPDTGRTVYNGVFAGCTSLNQNIKIPNGAIRSLRLFQHCHALNCQITIPDTMANVQEIFGHCYSFNQSVIFPDNVVSVAWAFVNCNKFNQHIYINHLASTGFVLEGMLLNCTEFGKDVYIKSGTTNPDGVRVSNLFRGTSNSRRKNIHFNSALNASFNRTNYQGLVGTTITWTSMTNGFYNAAYNIYCYNNYN